ncbi:MAG: Fe-S oxidoreductase [Rhodospirillaceae bacterium]|nr:MAG: Fe-S oxidoreductase [Rhodospirillaceae bacterium]
MCQRFVNILPSQDFHQDCETMPIHYNMPLWRPPSEGNNLIIQATLGCSYNHCSFCSMYTDKTFRARPLAEVCRDIDAGARDWPQADRVFLADGDAMVLLTEHLYRILDHLHTRLPGLARVSSYATPDNIRIAKGASPKGIARAIQRAGEAGVKVSCMVILGLGGREYSEQHIAATAALVNAAPPAYLSTLQLDLYRAEAPGFVPRWEKHGSRFQPLNDGECLDEMAHLIAALDPPRPIIFRSNHASNALPLGGVLPRDRAALLAAIALARDAGHGVRPRSVRGY